MHRGSGRREQPGADKREAKQSKEVCLGYLKQKTNVANTCGKKKKSGKKPNSMLGNFWKALKPEDQASLMK